VSFSRQAGLKRPVTLAVASAAMTAFALVAASGAQAQSAPAKADPSALYIVQVAGAPLATYQGGVAGIPGTRPNDGAKLNPRAWNYTAYRDHLRSARAEVIHKSGVDARKEVVSYDTTFNGFAARLTTADVARLKSTAGVVHVWKDVIHHVDTVTTPTFLGLEGPNGTWARQFGDVAHAGEGVIVGVIDTGFWPENASFAALSEPRPDQAAIDAKWSGTCEAGDDHPVACNNKVIGARWYNAAGLGDNLPGEFHSPRDFDGHGSHTASTAAGDHGVTATVNGTVIGQISGMAPAARLAVYKGLWEQPSGTASGSSVDLMNAIDDAVADGVDILSYSIGDNVDGFGPEEFAFLNAAAAGVFVSAAAGNAGPGASTVDNAMPWETTVAATTHDRAFTKTVTLGNGASYSGAGFGAAVASSPLVDAVNVGLTGAPAGQPELCYPGTLDPAQVAGKIVLCKRGVIARTDKSKAVQQAGGVGMILYNASPNSLNADFHFVPSIHVDQVAGAAIKAYLAGAGAGATAALSAGVQVKAEAPAMAAFSSRGPSPSSGGDLLKPDIAAPGVDVLAAVSPANHDGNLWDLESGTSMATPHISGIAALLKSRNPTWSPMTIKSALMTTAGQTDNAGKPIQDGGSNATPLDFGAGHVRPGSAFDPGLVYDSSPVQWLQYLCGIGVHLAFGDGSDVCDTTGTIDPSNLNYASIAVGDLAGKQTVTRTVTNVTNRASVYLARVQAPAGFSVKVKPSVLVVPPHKSASFKVEITRTTGAFGEWSFGSLTWSDLRGHNVRSPIAVRPVALAAPGAVVESGTSGTHPVSVRAGYTGTLTAAPAGLAAAAVSTQHLVGTNTTFDSNAPATGPAVGKITVNVPAGTRVARFATFAADYGAGADLDLFVYEAGTSNLVGASAGGTADEAVDVSAAGDYDVYVVQFALPSGVGEQDVKANSFIVAGAVGNMTATPASQAVTLGGAATVTIGWSRLTAGQHYLGVVMYGDGTNPVGSTLVAVNA
jgi:subtilisin family serine protease